MAMAPQAFEGDYWNPEDSEPSRRVSDVEEEV
jgi:hypothetical protein